jgi:CheY-like chemotaxis protein
MSTQSKTAAAPASGLDRPPGLCVLVVEDDEADAYLISRALSGQPAVGEVVRAPDGVEALEMVERGEVEPDLAFIDLHMPRKNGFSLLAAFASHPRAGFPMVVLTSSTAPTDAIRSRLRGAIRVVTKPDTVEELEAMLTSAIDAVCPHGSQPARARPVGESAALSKIQRFPGIGAASIDEIEQR